ncbi:PD40 domain-containing protein [Nocardioides stalactiti]|uniref:PD40 domain-containing protein n=1 Tax=Nocardioides stalactiti TaxID=2755356 RepID=UPI001600BFAD|nr:PD40 domain-containing protein [Nocardioides stalactiti]
MWSTLGPRRLLAASLSTVLGAAVALVPQEAAPAGPPEPVTPKITSGTNGVIAWTDLILDPNTSGVEGGSLDSTGPSSYFHLGDFDVAPRDPEFSPDGTQVAFTAYGAPGDGDGIWTVERPFSYGDEALQLTDRSSDTDPTWSPDGSRIAFLRKEAGGNGIFVVPAGGGTPIEVFHDEDLWGYDLSWSPDGTKIAFSNFSDEPFASPQHVYVLDIAAGTVVDLGRGEAPAWSPSGNRIAFQYLQSPGNWDIYWMNPDGTGRLLLLNASYSEEEPAWSPDGFRMAFLTPTQVRSYNWTNGGQAVVASTTTAESTTWGAAQPACQGRQATISGTSGPDTLRGSDGVDVIHGMGGDDTIIGLQGQDVLCGGAGSDTVSYEGQTAPATAYLGEISPTAAVSDLIAADVENLIGGAGPDTLVGDERINRIEGGDGADEITGGAGVDILVGGRGDDTLVGGDGDDALVGGGGDDLLVGEEGADQMSGAAGDDVLRGGEGADSMDGGLDADLLAGGPGLDTAQYGGRLVGVLVSLGAGGADDGSREDGTLGERDTVRGSVENVTGGSGADTLVGSEVANQLTGGAGADELRGGDGRDVLRANDGIKDRVIDCGDGDDAAAIRDSIDPAPISCP